MMTRLRDALTDLRRRLTTPQATPFRGCTCEVCSSDDMPCCPIDHDDSTIAELIRMSDRQILDRIAASMRGVA